MSKCALCGKGPQVGNSVSHANNKTKRRWNPNIQLVNAMVDGRPQKLRVCTSCLRSGCVKKNVQGQAKNRPAQPAA